jgi:hypothetical protein
MRNAFEPKETFGVRSCFISACFSPAWSTCQAFRPKVSDFIADKSRMDKKPPTARDVHEVFASVTMTLALICRLRGIEGHHLPDEQVNKLLFSAIDEHLGPDAVIGEILTRRQ